MIYYEPFSSGQTAHVRSLVEGLNPARFQVQIILPEHLAGEMKYFTAAGAGVTLAPIQKMVWKPAAVSSLAREIKADKNTIVHIHSQEAGLVGRPLAKLCGARYIVYTPQTIDIRRKQFQQVYAGAERLLAGITNRILSVNNSDRIRLINWGIPAIISKTVYNGIDLQKFNPLTTPTGLRPRMGINGSSPLILQIGRLSAQKAPLSFVEGAAIILQARPNTRFVMVGDGPLSEAVRQRVAELRLEEKVLLLGSCDEAYRLIPEANVVTLTSAWEGTPYSLLEAMGWAKPVVATTVNGCPEIVSDGVTGLLVPPDDSVSWAQAVMHIIDNPELAVRMGREGRRIVEEKFNVLDMVKQIEAVYENLVADRIGIAHIGEERVE